MKLVAQMPGITVILLWGLAATMLMTSMLYGSQRLGLSRLSLPFLVGTLFTANRSWAHILGFGFYLLGGWGFAFLYAAIFALTATTWWAGALIGFFHGIFLLAVILPVMPYIHPRMATEYDGPTHLRRLEPPGFFGLNYGYRTPASTLVAQVTYGLVLGLFLPG